MESLSTGVLETATETVTQTIMQLSPEQFQMLTDRFDFIIIFLGSLFGILIALIFWMVLKEGVK